jgi:N-acetylglucosaminyldiphosphoundecaprenol N-acetyl-beta-D-mannosaminyltransferase
MVQRRMKVIDILGTPLAATTYQELTEECQKLARRPGVSVVDLTNTQIVTMRRHEPEFRELTQDVDYFVPDGMPLIWTLNRRGANLTDRVYGPKFMRYCFLRSPAPFTHYLLGGSPDCLRSLQERLTAEQPALKIVGSRHGYFKAEDEDAITLEINTLSPDFIWVGLGTPKQQAWIHRHKAQIKRGVILAVGFAFDVNAGTKPDAPEWMQRRGLTWVFRIASEPRRLAKRYFRYNTLFLLYLIKDALTGRNVKS